MAVAAYRACRTRRQACRRRRGGDRLRHGLPRARPHVAGQHAALLAAVRRSRGSPRGSREAPRRRPGLRGAIRKGPVVLGCIASPDAASLPETKAGFAHGGDDPVLFAPHYPGAAASLTELQQDQGASLLDSIPEEDPIIRRMPMLVSRRHALSRSVGRDARLAQGASTYLVKSSGASGEKAFGEKTGIVAVKVGEFEVPTKENGQMWIRFTPERNNAICPPGKTQRPNRRGRAERPHPDHRHERGRSARPQAARSMLRCPASRSTLRLSSKFCKAASCNGPTSPRPPSSCLSSCSAR